MIDTSTLRRAAPDRPGRTALLALGALTLAGLAGARASAPQATPPEAPARTPAQTPPEPPGTPPEAPAAPVTPEDRDRAEALVVEGRTLLEGGETAAALERFEAAAALDPEARVWVARGLLGEERIDEALELADELKRTGASEADQAYIYGLGFLAAARREAAAGGGTYTQGQFEDATGFLVKATEVDAERYRDAFAPLAEAAWYAARLDVAAAAAERALERTPDDRALLVLRGKIAFSRYSQGRADEAAPDELETRWEDTRAAFEDAARAYGEPEDELARFELAGVHEQLGNLYLWREDRDGAAEAFREALARDPRTFDSADFNRLREGLGDERFATLTAGALDRFGARHADEPGHPGGPLLAWWAGFAAFENGDLPAAERHFLQAAAADSGYLNSWYYLFRAAYGQRAYDRALIALRSYWKQDPDGLAAMIEGQRDLNLRILEYLVGWLIDPEQQASERYLEASILARMMTRTAPDEPRYWNNLGLFLRDHGDQLKLRHPAPAEAELDDLWARAFAAYERTLELEPDHPAYINDTAVMLHYYLERDYDRAEAMYLRAAERAEEELAGTGLSTSDRAWFETALKDAGDNLEKLRAKRAALEPGS